jgi:hypothetical protein
MTVQLSTAARNGMLDAIESAAGTSAKFQIWTGSAPANCATASSGTKLVEISMSADWWAAASTGTKAFNSLPLTTTGLAAGSAGYFRIVDSAGTTCHLQGTVTATGGGGDLIVDNVSIAVGQNVSITAFTLTAPGA